MLLYDAEWGDLRVGRPAFRDDTLYSVEECSETDSPALCRNDNCTERLQFAEHAGFVPAITVTDRLETSVQTEVTSSSIAQECYVPGSHSSCKVVKIGKF